MKGVYLKAVYLYTFLGKGSRGCGGESRFTYHSTRTCGTRPGMNIYNLVDFYGINKYTLIYFILFVLQLAPAEVVVVAPTSAVKIPEALKLEVPVSVSSVKIF